MFALVIIPSSTLAGPRSILMFSSKNASNAEEGIYASTKHWHRTVLPLSSATPVFNFNFEPGWNLKWKAAIGTTLITVTMKMLTMMALTKMTSKNRNSWWWQWPPENPYGNANNRKKLYLEGTCWPSTAGVMSTVPWRQNQNPSSDLLDHLNRFGFPDLSRPKSQKHLDIVTAEEFLFLLPGGISRL